MIVNLFDNTFAHDTCSTAWKAPARVEYVRGHTSFDGVTLFTDGYLTRPEPRMVYSRVKLGWLHEPPCLIPSVYADAAQVGGHFDQVLTYDAELLKRPGFTFMPYGGVWIDRDDWGLHAKSSVCSMLVGAKKATYGHRIRHDVARAVDGLGVDFFGVRGQPTNYSITTKQRVLSGYAFSIVGEACRTRNLFTEILLDCFALGTIPVFWGCPNVGEFFEARGVLSFETPAQAADIARELSMGLYQQLLPYAKDNLAAAADYAVAEDWMYEHILKAYDD